MRQLASFFGRTAPAAQAMSGARPVMSSPCPDQPLCILGDLHGCLGLLQRFLALRHNRFPDHRLVVLGDMVDRGPDSAGVLAVLCDLPDAICLMGNHEAMLLAALDSPATAAAGWLRHGGLETLHSFGLRGLPRGADALQDRMAGLKARIGPTLEAWLRARPLWWQSGTLVAAHAGMDPARPPGAQDRRSLLWGHADFARIPRADGLHVAHGHVIVPHPAHQAGRIALDTGAYATGRLGFALLDPGLAPAERLAMAVLT